MRTLIFRPTWDAWSRCALEALAGETTPSEVSWMPEEHDAQSTLPFASPRRADDAVVRPLRWSEPAEVPEAFARFAKLAVHHRSDDRFALLYRLLWRLRHGEADLLDDMLDPDVFRLRRMAAAVRDDLKETRSRLRLRDPGFSARSSDRPRRRHDLPDLVAWCEPRHRTLPLIAEELASRSQPRSFALLSPHTSVFWDGQSLDLGPGAGSRDARSSDDLAVLWGARRHVAA